MKSEGAVRQEFFSVEETATITGMEHKAIRHAIDIGELVASDMRKKGAKRATYRIGRKAIDEWMASKQVPTKPNGPTRKSRPVSIGNVKDYFPD